MTVHPYQLRLLLDAANIHTDIVRKLATEAINAYGDPVETKRLRAEVIAAAINCDRSYRDLWSALGYFDPTEEEMRAKLTAATMQFMTEAAPWTRKPCPFCTKEHEQGKCTMPDDWAQLAGD